MDPVDNPYTPGAGMRPVALVGRGEVIKKAAFIIERVKRGYNEKCLALVGLRGVGKTVLLKKIGDEAEKAGGVLVLHIEATGEKSLPALLAPKLKYALAKLSHTKGKDLANTAMGALAAFVRAIKIRYGDVEVGFDSTAVHTGTADSGDLDADLPELLQQVGRVAQKAGVSLVLLVDEIQYLQKKELGALLGAMHQIAQNEIPIIMICAGLRHLRGRAGEAKTYSERMIEFQNIEHLEKDAARDALVEPAKAHNVEFTGEAIGRLVEVTHGYPYFLQEWGKQVWNTAEKSPIGVEDVQRSQALALAALDDSFFLMRFDRLTPKEKQYMRALAELGEGAHRSSEVAQLLGRGVTSLAPLRKGLINKGMLWSPDYGATEFSVPLFDDFMRRHMPGDDWREN